MSEPARRLPMFPLSTVLFPYAALPLHVFEPRYRALAEDCLAGDRTFGVVLIDRGSEVGGGDHRVNVGTVAQIRGTSLFDDGRRLLATEGGRRFRVTEWLEDDPYPVARVADLPEDPPVLEPGATDIRKAESAVRRCRALLSELGEAPPLALDEHIGDRPIEHLWRLCGSAPCGALDAQRLLETDDPAARASLLIELVEATADDVTRLLGSGDH
ncbi:MAG TPA: LON peptidase substrate-binding domain-containing protein [Acidimicrobiales bacterium]|nr:LON peptidase substrate-binding domain-containing protein [Acidimicrobiales bacterium]